MNTQGEKTYPITYAAKNKNEAVRSLSRSGGVFTELARPILDAGGIVYGCALTDDFMAAHVRVDSWDGFSRLRGSKYIQSDMSQLWASLSNDLKSGREVLFSGTPCQAAAVRSYVSFTGLPSDNLLIVDIVCHGVPSPAAWKAYLQHVELKRGGCIEAVDFRDKARFGWAAHHESFVINGQVYSSEIFKRLFYSHHIVRISCGKCPYKSTNRVGDISIADFWGIDKAVPGFNDDKGVSLVLINSPIGEKHFGRCSDGLSLARAPLDKCLQPALIARFPLPKDRDKFWRDFNAGRNLEWLDRKYAQPSIWRRGVEKLKHGIKKVIGR